MGDINLSRNDKARLAAAIARVIKGNPGTWFNINDVFRVKRKTSLLQDIDRAAIGNGDWEDAFRAIVRSNACDHVEYGGKFTCDGTGKNLRIKFEKESSMKTQDWTIEKKRNAAELLVMKVIETGRLTKSAAKNYIGGQFGFTFKGAQPWAAIMRIATTTGYSDEDKKYVIMESGGVYVLRPDAGVKEKVEEIAQRAKQQNKPVKKKVTVKGQTFELYAKPGDKVTINLPGGGKVLWDGKQIVGKNSLGETIFKFTLVVSIVLISLMAFQTIT